MSGLLLTEETVESALGVVAALALDTVPGSVGAGVTVIDHRGRRVSSGSTDPRVEQADALQYEFDEGPCLTAAGRRELVRIDDVATETRWPRWTTAVRSLGVRSTASAPLVAGNRSLGAIKVYGEQPAAFGSHSEQRLSMFAGQAALFVANAQTAERARRLSDDLRGAFRSRDVVNLAKGVLMGKEGVSEEAAFQLLLAHARTQGASVREAAQTVVTAAARRRR
ncbi:transcription antitermination regulator [Blastococcus sp. TF02A-30]|nr:transcription antitermination regulator [Blastococcus sp. TF02A-30]